MMQLWRLQEEAQHKLVSLSAIDPGSGSSSVAEIMLSDRRYDDPFGDYASVSTFIRRDPVTADLDEGPELYERRSLPVFGLSGRFYSCYVYVGRKKTEMPPSPSYLAKLIDASKHADLPRSHIEFLERLRSKDTH